MCSPAASSCEEEEEEEERGRGEGDKMPGGRTSLLAALASSGCVGELGLTALLGLGWQEGDSSVGGWLEAGGVESCLGSIPLCVAGSSLCVLSI